MNTTSALCVDGDNVIGLAGGRCRSGILEIVEQFTIYEFSVSYSIEKWGSLWPHVLKSKGHSVKFKGQVQVLLRWVSTWRVEITHIQIHTLAVYVQQKSYSRFC